MKRTDLARLRLENQRLTQRSFSTPAEVVRWFGAVQSQDLLASLWAIALRMSNATESLVERALTDGSIVRTWPMRCTIHCMPAENVRWMIRLLAPRGVARMKPYHRAMKITDTDLQRARKVLESALAGTQLTRPELYERFKVEGIATTLPGIPMRGLHLLVHWAQAGLICLASRRGKQPTFALLEEWTPPGRDLSGDDALIELATTYFRAHAPATTKDFAWWSSLPMAETKRAVHLAGDLLQSTTIDGIDYWQLRGAAPPPFSDPLPILLLPAFDEYTVAYSDRTVAADESQLCSISHGLSPNIVINGRIAGTWKRTLQANGSVVVTPSLLRILNRKEQAGLARATERYAAFLACKLDQPHPPAARMRKGKP